LCGIFDDFHDLSAGPESFRHPGFETHHAQGSVPIPPGHRRDHATRALHQQAREAADAAAEEDELADAGWSINNRSSAKASHDDDRASGRRQAGPW
jgi:hypothetical protein